MASLEQLQKFTQKYKEAEAAGDQEKCDLLMRKAFDFLDKDKSEYVERSEL